MVNLTQEYQEILQFLGTPAQNIIYWSNQPAECGYKNRAQEAGFAWLSSKPSKQVGVGLELENNVRCRCFLV